MSFHSSLYLIFIVVLFPLYWSFQGNRRLWILLAASIVYFLLGSSNDVLIVVALSLINFGLVRFLLQKSVAPVVRKSALFLGIALNLSVLIISKSGFVVDFYQASQPGGRSFFIFVLISFLVDSYRKPEEGAPFIKTMSAFVFFPTFRSGPLFRVKEWLGQEAKWPTVLSIESFGLSLYQISLGLFKKTLADLVYSICIDAQIFATTADGTDLWLRSLCVALRFYADFSGYSDIAMGTGRLLGFEIPNNFSLPFFASSLSEFWRDWHSSLGRWMHDYVYRPLSFSNALSFLRWIPLIGERIFHSRVYVAILVTMVAMGAWHGLTPIFVVWGVYHGILLVLETFLKSHYPSLKISFKWGRILITQYLVLIGFSFLAHNSVSEWQQSFVKMWQILSLEVTKDQLLLCVPLGLGILVPHLLDTQFLKLQNIKKKSFWLKGLLFCEMIFFFIFYVLFTEPGAAFVYLQF